MPKWYVLYYSQLVCLLTYLYIVNVSALPKHDHIEVFLQETWRDGLCKCPECLDNYKNHQVEFLLEEEKTHEPEDDEEEEDNKKSFWDIGLEQLESLDRVQVLEGLKICKLFKDDIKTYLDSFENSGKALTQQDIEDFFAVRSRN